MRRTVVMLMTGKAHVPYLMVCLKTLREQYHGDVCIFTTQDDTAALVAPLAKEFGCETRQADVLNVPKNHQFVTKVSLFANAQVPGDIACYLDADLIVRKPIDRLFDVAEDYGMCCTQFCNWTTAGGIIRGRIARWKDFDVDPLLLQDALSYPYPSPNGGIFAAKPGTQELQAWLKLTMRGIESFIADEVALNILLPQWLNVRAGCLTGGAWNCSPKHKPADVSAEDVVIWHGHGDSFARPDKGGVEMWLPMFRECWARNVGRCNEWADWHCGNKHLAKLEMGHGRMYDPV